MSNPDARTIVVTIRTEPGWQLPFSVRARRWLKLGLRAFGLRCVEIREQPNAQEESCSSH